jgi:hypothetical protein
MTDNNNTSQTKTSQNNTTNNNSTSSDSNAIPPAIAELDKKHLDIQGILDKIKTLPIDDKDKATILEQFKDNILNPGKSENKSLDQIQSKYTAMENPQQMTPMDFLPPVNANYPYGYGRQQHHLTPQQMYQQQSQQLPQQGSQMTTAHFEILKNKLDSLQFELIDLLRHVKDYTQRYMNAVRQQDLDKINDYINGLFQVDKTLKETQEKSEEAAIEEPTEEEAATKESVISKATSGIKNFLGGIGDNVSGITNLVTNTANIANGYLTKKIIPTSNASTNANTSGKTNTNTSTNKNIVSVDEYISNMNNLEEPNTTAKPETVPIPNSNIVSSNANNFNLNSNTNNTKDKGARGAEALVNKGFKGAEAPLAEAPLAEAPLAEASSSEASSSEVPVTTKEEDLDSALETLNDKMNEDIEKTVNQTGGSSTHKDKLTKKISLLRLKLTKKRLQKQLKEENRNKNSNNNYNNNKTKHNNYIPNNKLNNKNKNKNMKKSKINKK